MAQDGTEELKPPEERVGVNEPEGPSGPVVNTTQVPIDPRVAGESKAIKDHGSTDGSKGEKPLLDRKGRFGRPRSKSAPRVGGRGGPELSIEGSSVAAGRDVRVESHIGDSYYVQEAELEKRLSEISNRLPEEEICCPQSLIEEIDDRVIELKRDRIILIACFDESIGRGAARAIIDRLGISDDKGRRYLNFELFEKGVRKEWIFNVHSLSQLEIDTGVPTGIVVDDFDGDVQTFSRSMFGSRGRALDITQTLKDKDLFVVCVAELGNFQKRLSEVQNTSADLREKLSFPHWPITRWQLLLKEKFPDRERRAGLEAKLEQQRQMKKWASDEGEFCRQLEKYIETGNLLEVVEGGGPRTDTSSIEAQLKNNDPVIKAVLYTATFFQELTRAEFCTVVETLLSDRTVTVIDSPYKTAGNGSNGARKEVTLARIWEEEKDEIFGKWLCETPSVKGTSRVVTFLDPGLRDSLRKRFEEEYLFYLIDKFKIIQERGIFFYPSSRVLQSTTRLAIDMAISYPDEYGASWITDMVLRLSRQFEGDSISTNAVDPMFRFVKGSTKASRRRAYSRISELIRQMLECPQSPQLRKVADNSLDDLIRERLFGPALVIIKQLRFAPEFDDLYWIKQILQRGNERIRSQAYDYLCSYAKSMDTGIYGALAKLDSWLPKEEEALDAYSYPSRSAFCMFIDFCWETNTTFDSKDYGRWPSPCPMFALRDRETAVSSLAMTARWLLHPGLARELDDLPLHWIGAMVAGWTFILLGPKGKPGAASTNNRNPTSAISSTAGIDASTVWNILLQEILARTDAKQRRELREYWDELYRYLDELGNAYRYTSDERKELFWKRELIDTLKRRCLKSEGK